MNLVTPKVGAKHEVLVNELATDQSVFFVLLVLLVAAAKILADKVGTVINSARLPSQPAFLV